ncbi:cytochrome P450 2F2-like [Discoglossus pictus]
MDLFLLAVSFLLLLLSFVVVPYVRMRRAMVNLPPGPIPLPFIGSLWKMDLHNTVKTLMELNKSYGDIFTIWQGHQPYIVLCGYQAIKETLIDKAQEFSNRAPYPSFSNFTKGDDIGFSNGEKWRQLRHFTLTTLRDFGMGKRRIEEQIKEEAQYLVNVLKEKNGSPIDLTLYVSRSVSNVICSVIFGSRFDYSDKDFQKLVQCIQDNFMIMSSPWGELYNIYHNIMDYIPGPHKTMMANFKSLTDFVEKRVEENKKTLNHDQPRDFIDCFLIKMEKEGNHPNSYFTPKSLAMSSMVLFFGGTETVGTTLRFGFLLLMKHPKLQCKKKVYKEIVDVIGHQRSANYEDRMQMPYTNAFIHEVQRYSNVIPLPPARELTMDTQIRSYKFRKGTPFLPFLASVHHDESQFRYPERFDPRNFLNKNGQFKKNKALMAFSTGKRICPGETLSIMELFLYFTIIVQNFTIKSLVPPEEISTTPVGVGFGNIPPMYECCLIPH